MELRASLKATRSSKDDKEDITRTVVFHMWSDDPTIMAKLDALYNRPLKITIEEAR